MKTFANYFELSGIICGFISGDLTISGAVGPVNSGKHANILCCFLSIFCFGPNFDAILAGLFVGPLSVNNEEPRLPSHMLPESCSRDPIGD